MFPGAECLKQLFLSLNFRSKGLKLSPNFILNVTLKLENVGEMANEPALSFHYSPVLSFRGASVLQVSRRGGWGGQGKERKDWSRLERG